MNAIEEASKHLGLYAGIVAALSLLIPKVREFVAWFARGAWIIIRLPFLVEEMRRDVSFVKAQVVQNGGGSLKDATNRLECAMRRVESYRRHDFWTKGRPAMEMDGDGHVSLVSEACCQLFAVRTPEELFRRSWGRFVAGDAVGDFLDTYLEIAEASSIFRYEVPLYDLQRSPLGTWEFRACPIVRLEEKDVLYSGYWVPVCDRARQIAAEKMWAI